MKRILTTMCALTLLLAASVPALAVEPEQSASYYPTSVEEYMEGDSPRIKKVYQLSLADDPSQIPTEDFERDGRLYYLLDMTRKDEVGVDIQTITQTKTLASETNNMEKILQSLEPQMEVTTEDGYTGTLTLDHTTVKVAADGYATKVIPKRSGMADRSRGYVPPSCISCGARYMSSTAGSFLPWAAHPPMISRMAFWSRTIQTSRKSFSNSNSAVRCFV